MTLRRPSPSMVVAIAALVMASTGTGIAAVSYASNAGAVDHFSAVGASTSSSKAAGRLVATASGGRFKGQIPPQFLGGVPKSDTFGQALPVNDNTAGGAIDLDTGSFGRLSMACNDQNNKAGVEDPSVDVSFTNTNPATLNFGRSVGEAAATIGTLPPATQHKFTINGQNTFHIHLEAAGYDVIYDGIARQVGQGTADGACVLVGALQTINPG